MIVIFLWIKESKKAEASLANWRLLFLIQYSMHKRTWIGPLGLKV